MNSTQYSLEKQKPNQQQSQSAHPEGGVLFDLDLLQRAVFAMEDAGQEAQLPKTFANHPVDLRRPHLLKRVLDQRVRADEKASRYRSGYAVVKDALDLPKNNDHLDVQLKRCALFMNSVQQMMKVRGIEHVHEDIVNDVLPKIEAYIQWLDERIKDNGLPTTVNKAYELPAEKQMLLRQLIDTKYDLYCLLVVLAEGDILPETDSPEKLNSAIHAKCTLLCISSLVFANHTKKTERFLISDMNDVAPCFVADMQALCRAQQWLDEHEDLLANDNQITVDMKEKMSLAKQQRLQEFDERADSESMLVLFLLDLIDVSGKTVSHDSRYFNADSYKNSYYEAVIGIRDLTGFKDTGLVKPLCKRYLEMLLSANDDLPVVERLQPVLSNDFNNLFNKAAVLLSLDFVIQSDCSDQVLSQWVSAADTVINSAYNFIAFLGFSLDSSSQLKLKNRLSFWQSYALKFVVHPVPEIRQFAGLSMQKQLETTSNDQDRLAVLEDILSIVSQKKHTLVSVTDFFAKDKYIELNALFKANKDIFNGLSWLGMKQIYQACSGHYQLHRIVLDDYLEKIKKESGTQLSAEQTLEKAFHLASCDSLFAGQRFRIEALIDEAVERCSLSEIKQVYASVFSENKYPIVMSDSAIANRLVNSTEDTEQRLDILLNFAVKAEFPISYVPPSGDTELAEPATDQAAPLANCNGSRAAALKLYFKLAKSDVARTQAVMEVLKTDYIIGSWAESRVFTERTILRAVRQWAKQANLNELNAVKNRAVVDLTGQRYGQAVESDQAEPPVHPAPQSKYVLKIINQAIARKHRGDFSMGDLGDASKKVLKGTGIGAAVIVAAPFVLVGAAVGVAGIAVGAAGAAVGSAGYIGHQGIKQMRRPPASERIFRAVPILQLPAPLLGISKELTEKTVDELAAILRGANALENNRFNFDSRSLNRYEMRAVAIELMTRINDSDNNQERASALLALVDYVKNNPSDNNRNQNMAAEWVFGYLETAWQKEEYAVDGSESFRLLTQLLLNAYSASDQKQARQILFSTEVDNVAEAAIAVLKPIEQNQRSKFVDKISRESLLHICREMHQTDHAEDEQPIVDLLKERLFGKIARIDDSVFLLSSVEEVLSFLSEDGDLFSLTQKHQLLFGIISRYQYISRDFASGQNRHLMYQQDQLLSMLALTSANNSQSDALNALFFSGLQQSRDSGPRNINVTTAFISFLDSLATRAEESILGVNIHFVSKIMQSIQQLISDERMPSSARIEICASIIHFLKAVENQHFNRKKTHDLLVKWQREMSEQCQKHIGPVLQAIGTANTPRYIEVAYSRVVDHFIRHSTADAIYTALLQPGSVLRQPKMVMNISNTGKKDVDELLTLGLDRVIGYVRDEKCSLSEHQLDDIATDSTYPTQLRDSAGKSLINTWTKWHDDKIKTDETLTIDELEHNLLPIVMQEQAHYTASTRSYAFAAIAKHLLSLQDVVDLVAFAIGDGSHGQSVEGASEKSNDQPLARQMQKPTLATRLGTNLDVNIYEIYQHQDQDQLCDLILSVIKPSQPLLELDKAYRFQEYPHHQLVMKRSQAIDQKNQYNQESDQLSIKYNQDCEQLRQKYSQVHQSDLSQEEYRQQQTKLEQEYSQQEAKLSQERDQYLKYNSFQDYGYKLMKKYSAIKATVEQAIMEKYKGSRDIRAYKDNDIHPHLKTLIADEVRKAG